MSGYHVHIVDNAQGSNDKVAVIMQGEVIYSGPHPDGKQLKELFENINGFEFLKYHPTDDKGIKDPNTVVYGGDDLGF